MLFAGFSANFQVKLHVFHFFAVSLQPVSYETVCDCWLHLGIKQVFCSRFAQQLQPLKIGM
jgi:hypothetical protein